jgi:hypothetical protein
VNIGGRLAKVLARLDLARRCPGPPVSFYRGTRAELDALELPDDCRLCGRPLAEHAPFPRYIFVVTDACTERGMERNGGRD